MTPSKKQFILSFISFVLFFSFDSFAQDHNKYDENGKRTGIWRKYYPNKRICYSGQFVNGKEVGTFKYFDILSSKHPTAIKKFYSKSDSAFVQFFTTEGVLRSKGMMLNRDRVGKWMYYFPTGKVFSEEFYIQGKLDGEVKTYYKNGNIFEISHYKNGLKNGVLKRYSDKEILIEEVFYVDGKLNGEGKYYDLQGNLKEKGIYKNNKRFGKWEFYIGGELVDEKKKKELNKFNTSQLKKNDSISKN